MWPLSMMHWKPLYRDTPRLTCSNLFYLDLIVQGPHLPDMFKLVYYEAHPVGKRAVDILLECFLV